MKIAAIAEDIVPQRTNRRNIQRFDVDEDATLLLVNHGSYLPCRVIDLSLGGCRIYTNERFQAGILVRVEVNFKVRGLAFRFSGVTQWTDSRHLVGVRFVDVILRRKNDLEEALSEVELQNAAKAEKVAADLRIAQEKLRKELAGEEQTEPVSEEPESEEQVEERLSWREEKEEALLEAEPPLPEPQAPPVVANKSDRRAQNRQGVDTSAVIHLVKIASKISGRILDLSLGGCRIRTDVRFPVGIYTRVETEFRLEGLPFRLAGVVQAIHDHHNVGIRFLDMSPRKQDQVEQLIAEIEEMRRLIEGGQ